MSDKREQRSNVQILELTLTLLAVIAGSVAATGSFLGASYERDRVELERRPAVLLACQPEFHALDVAEGARPPTNTILLTAKGARWIHIVSDGQAETPQPFARCTLTSYGRLPVFNLRVNLAVQLLGVRHDALATVDSSFDVPGLSPSEPYPFGLINAANGDLKFQFARSLSQSAIQREERSSFVDGTGQYVGIVGVYIQFRRQFHGLLQPYLGHANRDRSIGLQQLKRIFDADCLSFEHGRHRVPYFPMD